jgi:hypothetical protein
MVYVRGIPVTDPDGAQGEKMKKQIGWWLAPLFAIAVSMNAGTAFAGHDSETAVREAAAGFYSALDVFFTGDLGPMTKVWSHADDVTYMGPDGGFEVGWPQVLEDWKKQAAMKLGGRVEPQEMRVFVGGRSPSCRITKRELTPTPEVKAGRFRSERRTFFGKREASGRWLVITRICCRF